ncbi:MAG: carbohydrate-binding domain-containing protein [Anaerolineaceae bacterium]|nr:carbohydrate-binding domain-containing protein [Anaerolineaceae bacterium]
MQKTILFLGTLILVFSLSACAAASPVTAAASAAPAATATPAQAGSGEEATVESTPAATLEEALAANRSTHEEDGDYEYDPETAVTLTLDGDAIQVTGSGVSVEGAQATITAAGTYVLSGALADGQIMVDTPDEDPVRLVLDGVELSSSTGAPLYVAAAEKVILILPEGSHNTVSDAASYVYASAEEDEPNAAIFSKADLSIAGSGALTVNGNYLDGITSKDGLVIAGGVIAVTAADDGVRGKDYLVIEGGSLTVTSGGDGLKADNAEDAGRGYVAVTGGALQVNAGGDAIDAQTDVIVSGGDFKLVSGGGSLASVDDTTSAKGIKGTVSVLIQAGSFEIDSADDAIHSNGSVTLNGGTFTLASGDDGVHADESLTVNGGELQVTRSYEGLESAVITLNDGNIHVVASDDGVNVAGGNDGSGMGAGRPGVPGQDSFASRGSYYLYIHGGTLYVDAQGDGIDVNGTVEMTAGTVVVVGPTQQMNGALDYDGGFTLSGGTIVAVGSSGMAMTPNQGQFSVLVYLTETQPAGTLVHLQNAAGEDLLTFAPTREYQSIAFSSPQLAQGETYTLYTGGSSSGTSLDGVYQGGTYTPGSEAASFTITSTQTTVGTGGRMGPGGMGGPGGGPGGGGPGR